MFSRGLPSYMSDGPHCICVWWTRFVAQVMSAFDCILSCFCGMDSFHLHWCLAGTGHLAWCMQWNGTYCVAPYPSAVVDCTSGNIKQRECFSISNSSPWWCHLREMDTRQCKPNVHPKTGDVRGSFGHIGATGAVFLTAQVKNSDGCWTSSGRLSSALHDLVWGHLRKVKDLLGMQKCSRGFTTRVLGYRVTLFEDTKSKCHFLR